MRVTWIVGAAYRSVIAGLLCLAALAAPARAQAPPAPAGARVALLTAVTRNPVFDRVLLETLREAGWVIE